MINFRALLHAPVNEGGVMVLFGMAAKDLGFVIESVARPGFRTARPSGGWPAVAGSGWRSSSNS